MSVFLSINKHFYGHLTRLHRLLDIKKKMKTKNSFLKKKQNTQMTAKMELSPLNLSLFLKWSSSPMLFTYGISFRNLSCRKIGNLYWFYGDWMTFEWLQLILLIQHEAWTAQHYGICMTKYNCPCVKPNLPVSPIKWAKMCI